MQETAQKRLRLQGQNAPERTAAEAKGLVVYFSWSGNTENVANSIKDQTGSDIFEIVPQTPYSDDYDTVVDLARGGTAHGCAPEISGSIDNIAQYDVIYVGYPNWWGRYADDSLYLLIPMTCPVKYRSFLTSGGSGFSDSINDYGIRTDASVLKDSLSSSRASDPGSDVADW